MIRSRAALLLASALALFAAACGEGFDPAYRLTKMRVLGIQGDPVAPAVGETTVFTPILFEPEGREVDSFAWSWCPLAGSSSDGFPCLVAEEELAAFGDDLPPYDLGSEPTASFTNAFDPDLLGAACDAAAMSGGLLDCDGGFPIQIRMVVTAGEQRIDVVRQLRLRFRPEDAPNANPVIDDIRVEALGGGDQVSLDEGGAVTLRRREERVLHAVVPEEVSEPYVGTDDAGEPIDTAELIVLSWFVETGVLRYDRTSYVPDVSPAFEGALENEWEPDDDLDFGSDTATIVVVVRDDRNGIAAKRAVVTLGDAP
jgi:hypothetical protein